MPEEPPKASPPSRDSDWAEWLKPRRWFLFARRVFNLESTVEGLKGETRSLQSQIHEMQRDVIRLQSQVEILVSNLPSTIDDKVRIAVLERVPDLVNTALAGRAKGGGCK